jgi:adenine-specific DNA-methyltransferase
VITDFGEPVLPGFQDLGSIERGGDKPHHVVINGENHHALEALRFTHTSKIDCIYIDPPYNSGARDWKYNNDYVDDTDAYRHSKWLAFMERRLKLAKDLLNPDDSVLIVTIDEKEYLRLGLLLEQTFSAARVRMISSEISRKGSARADDFARVDEYIYVLMFGAARVAALFVEGMSVAPAGGRKQVAEVTWESMLRRGTGSKRADSKLKFYPVLVDPTTRSVIGCGETLPAHQHPTDYAPPNGLVAVWPLRSNGAEGRWQLNRASFAERLAAGHIKAGRFNRDGTVAILYLPSGLRAAIASGRVIRSGTDSNGGPQFAWVDTDDATGRPKTQWSAVSHNASENGTALLQKMLPERRFPFPKSLYAIEDVLRLFVNSNPGAVVLDFFAGSGTTAHAVARLNRQDGGARQCILVTNNEVSVDEARDLRQRGLRPGDTEWEEQGIFEYITRPRVTAAITGKTPDGEPIAGDYRFTDEFPMADGFEENVAYLELRYLDADDIDLGQAFDEMAPLLWLRAGGQGPIVRRIDDAGAPLPYSWTDRYGVLFDEDRWRSFVSARPETAQAAFIVTYSPTVFAGIAAELPPSMDTIRLYDTYLSMFLPERGRA